MICALLILVGFELGYFLGKGVANYRAVRALNAMTQTVREMRRP